MRKPCGAAQASSYSLCTKPQNFGIPPQLLALAKRNQHGRARLRGLLHFPKMQVVCISPVLAPALGSGTLQTAGARPQTARGDD